MNTAKPPPATATSAAKRAERAILAVALIIIGLRPLISESLDAAQPTIVASMKGVTSPLPFISLLFDLIMLALGASWIILARVFRLGPRRLHIGTAAALLITAWIGSTLLAGNRRLAVNTALESAAAVSLIWLLAQILNSRRRMHLALCVIGATGVVQAVECFHQRWLVFPEAKELYAKQREQIWASRGLPLDSETVKLFEARLNAREAAGFLSHSNIAAAHLLTCGLLVACLAVSRDHRSGRLRPHVGPLLLTACLACALWLTKGRAAMISVPLTVGYVWVRHRFIRRATDHADGPTLQYLRFWRRCVASAVVACIAVFAVGCFHGSLPTRSLDFRWKYWTAAAAMFVDQPVFGVGPGNFGRRFPQYKTIDCPDEVANPHDFLATAASETGILGLTGLVVLILTLSAFGITSRHSTPPQPADPTDDVQGDDRLPRALFEPPADPEPANGPPGNRLNSPAAVSSARPDTTNGASIPQPQDSLMNLVSALLTAAGLCAAIFLLRAPLLGVDDPNYIYFATVWPMIVWPIAFVLLAVGVRTTPAAMSLAASAALVGFFIQDSVNFALQVPGTLFTAATLVAVMLAGRIDHNGPNGNDSAPATPPSRSICIITSLLLLAATAFILLPVARSNIALASARQLVKNSDPKALDYFLRAEKHDPLDPQPLIEAARFQASLAARSDADGRLMQAADLLDRAIERDPYQFSIYRNAARVYLLRFEQTHDPSAIDRAIALAGSAESLYPTSPDQAELTARCLAARAQYTQSPDHAGAAAAAYERALRLDAQRPAWERIRRFSAQHRKELSAEVLKWRSLARQTTTGTLRDSTHTATRTSWKARGDQ